MPGGERSASAFCSTEHSFPLPGRLSNCGRSLAAPGPVQISIEELLSFHLAHGQFSRLAGDLPSWGRLLAIVMSSAAGLWKLFRDQAERGSGIGLERLGVTGTNYQDSSVRPRPTFDRIMVI